MSVPPDHRIVTTMPGSTTPSSGGVSPTRARRSMSSICRIPDRPGGLARLLAELAEVEANVLDVVHERTSAHLHLGEVAVGLQVETRGPEHTERVLGHLRGRGYAVTDAPEGGGQPE